MKTITTFTSELGLKLYIDTTGEMFATPTGLAQICNVSPTSIVYFLAVHMSIAPKPMDITTDKGLVNVVLYDEKAIVSCVVKYCPDLMVMFREEGFRKTLHALVGYRG